MCQTMTDTFHILHLTVITKSDCKYLQQTQMDYMYIVSAYKIHVRITVTCI